MFGTPNILLKLIWLLCFIPFFAGSQPYSFKQLSLDRGLSNRHVLDIAHDKDGFVWIATELGLNRFSGASFRPYFKSDQMDGTSVNSNEINCLYYDEVDNRLYIGTKSNGLNVLDLTSGTFSYYLHKPDDPQSIATNDITDIIKGIDGFVWIATYHQGVQRFDPKTGQFERFNKTTIPGFPSNSVWSLAQDRQGLLYIGLVDDGLTILNPKTKVYSTLSNQNENLPSREVKVVYYDSEQNVWIGTREGLVVYNPMTTQVRRIPLSRQNSEHFIYSIQEIDDKIWVGSESSSIYIIPKKYVWEDSTLLSKYIQHVDQTLGFDVSVQDISTDQFGNIWFANYGLGLGFIGHIPAFFDSYPYPAALAKDNRLYSISAIVEGVGGDYWLATEGNGVVRLASNGEINTKGSMRDVGGMFVFSAFRDIKESLWFGFDRGVAVFDQIKGVWNTVNKEISEVRAIVQDTRENIWLAGREELYIYDASLSSYERLTISDSRLGDYAARALLEDDQGAMWVGTYGQGIYIYNTKRELIKRFSVQNGLPSNTVNHLFKDSEGKIWIATNEGVVHCDIREGYSKMETLAIPRQQTSLITQAIAEDIKGNIWISTNSGVLQYIPQDGKVLSYDKYFGVPLGGFKSGSTYTDKRGNILFGTSSGICLFNPLDIPLDIPLPQVRFNRIFVCDNREANTSLQERTFVNNEVLRLRYSENTFRIEYAVADYALTGLIEYSYQLEGIDKVWNSVGEEQVMDFRNIPAGEYELRVRARYKNAAWTDEYVSLNIAVVPPFYLSLTAILLYIVAVALVVFLIVFFYLRKVRLENELRLKKNEHEQREHLYVERLNFFTNITHELRTPLTMILGPLEDLLRNDGLEKKQRELVELVQNSANRLFGLVNQLLEFRKVESEHKDLVLGDGHLEDLVIEIVNKYRGLNTKKGLEIVYTPPPVAVKTRFDVDIMQMVLDNLLSNAYKFTTEGTIEVHLYYLEQDLAHWAVIEVKDSGMGIPIEMKDKIFERYYQIENSDGNGTGIGLALVKELMSIHHGHVQVDSTLGRGSVFTVRFVAPVVGRAASDGFNITAVESDKAKGRFSVLLVEDDPTLRGYLRSILEDEYDIFEAGNGEEGFQRALQEIPDIIISDVMMPELDGFAMTEKLRSRSEVSHIPVVLLTAMNTDQDREKGYRLGIDSFLTKPVLTRTLKSRLHNIFERRKELYKHFLSQQGDEDSSLVDSSEEQGFNLEVLKLENKFIQDLVETIEERFQDQGLDIQFLSDRMNMSASTLYRKVKALTGKSINQFIRKVRMKKASELLQSGNYNITEVAFLVGINSLVYFRQCFKEEFGELPSKFAKKSHAK